MDEVDEDDRRDLCDLCGMNTWDQLCSMCREKYVCDDCSAECTRCGAVVCLECEENSCDCTNNSNGLREDGDENDSPYCDGSCAELVPLYCVECGVQLPCLHVLPTHACGCWTCVSCAYVHGRKNCIRNMHK